jgi:hypothetical protein
MAGRFSYKALEAMDKIHSKLSEFGMFYLADIPSWGPNAFKFYSFYTNALANLISENLVIDFASSLGMEILKQKDQNLFRILFYKSENTFEPLKTSFNKDLVFSNKVNLFKKITDLLKNIDDVALLDVYKTLLDKLHKKLTNQLRAMDIDMDDFKEKRKYLVSAPMLGHMYLLIKVHKKNFPGRAVVSQVNDPTYKVCKILTDILSSLATTGKSYIENSYDLKNSLSKLSIDPVDIQVSFDVVALYPSIPIPKALECVRRRLLSDSTLSERTDWNPDDIMKLLEICLETHFKTIDGNIYTQLDGTPI